MINRFILNEVSYFGPGAREVLPKEITRLGLHKAFVATDKDLIKYGVADKVLSVLKSPEYLMRYLVRSSRILQCSM